MRIAENENNVIAVCAAAIIAIIAAAAATQRRNRQRKAVRLPVVFFSHILRDTAATLPSTDDITRSGSLSTFRSEFTVLS